MFKRLLIVLFSLTLVYCANIRPVERHPSCGMPRDMRTSCIDGSQCPTDYICTFRNSSVGKCKHIDCCDPWRDGGKHAFGDDWCRKKLDKDSKIKYTEGSNINGESNENNNSCQPACNPQKY
jgi:hypothetical protein